MDKDFFAIQTAGAHSYKPAHLFRRPPSGVFPEPQEVAVDVAHLSWDAERVVGVAAVKYGTKKVV